jgi:glycosyltransferase involved in cell wall biosynthesis/SAM-dependent methyltransferase
VPELQDGDAGPVTIPGLVSTIIPVYNRAGLLREAVQSVLDQTYDNIEVIIVDDGSTDDTVAACDEMAGDHPEVRVLRVPHRGRPGLAREAGRLVARGEYIQYLDSDDVLASTKFATMVSVLTGHPECDVAYCPTGRYRIGGPLPDHPWGLTGQSFGTMLPACVSRRLWLTPTPLYRRSLCDAVGPWSDLSLWEDIEYDMRIATRCRGLYHCAEMLVDVRDHDQGRLSGVDFFSDPEKMGELARAVRLVYESVKRCNLPRGEEHVEWFLDDVRLIRRRCLELKLDAAAEECTRLLLEATGSEEPEQVGQVSIRARIQPQVAVLRAPPGAAVRCPVIVRNESRIAFRTGNEFAFQLSSRVLSIDRILVRPQTNVALFEPPLRPGEERELYLWIETPDASGLYLAEIDILWSPSTWLGSLGNRTSTIKLVVTNFVKKHEWRLQLTEDNEAKVAFPGGHVESIRLHVTRATTGVPWHIQLNQDALKLAAQQRYVVRFDGQADSSREVGVGVSMAHPPWQGLGLYARVELGPDWKSFELDFMAAAHDDNARLHFDAGGSDVGVELRNVSVTDATRGIQIEPPPLSYLARHQMDLGVKPLSDWWGTDRGLAIHRYYLENFLAEFARDIRGRCLEFQDPQYTHRFGGAAVTALDILHIDDSNPEATLVADLTQPNTLPSDAFDCVLCSHVLHTIFEVEKAVREIHRILKPGGVLLAAVPHISMNGTEWGEIWRFTPEGLRILLSRVFGPEHVTWRAYGNSLTAAGELRGLASHEFCRDELDSHDMRFAVEVCARGVKK